METSELESKVYNALISSAELVDLLPKINDDIPIFHLFAPALDTLKYPVLVYAPLNDVPSLYVEDLEVVHKVRIRISIITNDGQYSEINKIVRQIMVQGLEFKRVDTVPAVDFDNNKVILNCDYEKNISA